MIILLKRDLDHLESRDQLKSIALNLKRTLHQYQMRLDSKRRLEKLKEHLSQRKLEKHMLKTMVLLDI